jgi:hypothetical protein
VYIKIERCEIFGKDNMAFRGLFLANIEESKNAGEMRTDDGQGEILKPKKGKVGNRIEASLG